MISSLRSFGILSVFLENADLGLGLLDYHRKGA